MEILTQQRTVFHVVQNAWPTIYTRFEYFAALYNDSTSISCNTILHYYVMCNNVLHSNQIK